MAENNYEDLFNSDVIDVDGNKIGSIGQVYLDDQTGQPTWVTVKTGWFGLKETFVPLEQAVLAEGTITVPYTEEKVKEAPRVDPDKHLDANEEAELYGYYGIATVLAEAPEAEDVVVADEVAVDEPVLAGDEVVVDEVVADEVVADDEVAAPAIGDEVIVDDAVTVDEPVTAEAPLVDEEILVSEPVADEVVAAEDAVIGGPLTEEMAVDEVVADEVAADDVVVADEDVAVAEPLPEVPGDEEIVEDTIVEEALEDAPAEADLYDNVKQTDQQ